MYISRRITHGQLKSIKITTTGIDGVKNFPGIIHTKKQHFRKVRIHYSKQKF